MGLLHRLIPWAYSADEHGSYYIGLLISTHVLRNKHVLINKPTPDEQTHSHAHQVSELGKISFFSRLSVGQVTFL